MSPSDDNSLGGEATFAGQAKPQRADVSLGEERTLGGADAVGIDTALDGLEVVDLEARYRIEGTLGQGGMGAVVLATDTRLGRKVAIKRILGEAARSKAAIVRFLTEAKAIAALNHPNIVQIHDYGRAKDGPFLILEYVDGGSLSDLCARGAIPLERSLDLICQVCDGLAKAHDAGIIHRDIKPANVLLSSDGRPKLTDFGLAKAEAADHGMTMTGAVMGTPDFMPPEQRRDASEVDHRSDLWSLAATVYQMVTGRSPKIIRFNDIPASLQDVLGKALEDRKDARYQSAREFRDALKTVVRAAPVAIAGDLAEGKCPACGTHNDTNRKFCRACAEPLVAPCLGCGESMALWDEVCGSCGVKQTPLIEERRQAMAASQAEAEGLLGDCEFDRASAIANQLRSVTHPKLGHLTSWTAPFLEQIEASRAEQTRHAVEAIIEAGKHEAAHDYVSAELALKTVPESMRASTLPGASESAASALARHRKTLAEVQRLNSLITQRVAAKSLDGLLPDVEKLLALCPDREDIDTLRDQLLQREHKRIAALDEAIVTAKACLAARDYGGALAALDTIPAQAVNQEIKGLRTQAQTLARQADTLARKIKEAVAAKLVDGLLDDVEQCLQLKPADEKLMRLRQALLNRESMLSAARSSLARWKYDDALSSLSSINPALVDKTVCKIKDDAEHAIRRINELSAALWSGDSRDDEQKQSARLEELLSLRPDDPRGLQLKSDLAAAKREDIATRRRELLDQARSLMADHQYDEVLDTLSGIRPELESPDLEAVRDEARHAIISAVESGRWVITELDEQESSVLGLERAASDYLQTKPYIFRDPGRAKQLLATARRVTRMGNAKDGAEYSSVSIVSGVLIFLVFGLITIAKTKGEPASIVAVGFVGALIIGFFVVKGMKATRRERLSSKLRESVMWAVTHDLRTLANSSTRSTSFGNADSDDALIIRADQLARDGKFTAAGALYASAISASPSDVRGWVRLGQCYIRRNHLAEAIATLKMAESRFPKCATVHYNLACYLARAKDRPGSVSYLQKAIGLDPRYREQAATDPDFDSVRRSEEFKKAISEAGSQSIAADGESHQKTESTRTTPARPRR